ncbi:MAG: hypothetical protein JKY50_10975 [Oleispira sp.]|nr:hypothetical protein [Oleispira sp.]
MNIAIPRLKSYIQFIMLSFILVFTTACSVSETEEEPVDFNKEQIPGPNPEPSPEPAPTPEPTVLDPVSISQGSDDGYSWGKYGNSDWEADNVDNDFIRLGAAGNEDRDYISSYMFREVNIAPGQNILTAKIVFTKHTEEPSDSATLDLTIKAINPLSQTTFSVGDLGQDRAVLSAQVQWNKSANNWQTPDLAKLIQAIVSNSSWDANQAMGFVIQNTSGAGGNGRHNIYSANSSNSDNHPKLLITYGDDVTAPRISNPSPSGVLSLNTTNTVLSINTDEPASCKFSEQADTLYADMASTLSTSSISSQKQHQASLTGLTQGTDYHYYIRCADVAGNTTGVDFMISFAIANLTDPLVTLTVKEPANSVRDNQIVRTGVPFPKGLVQADDAIQLTTAGSNTPLPLQTRPLSLWDDGSVRWLLLDTQISLAAEENKSLQLKYAASAITNDSPLRISQTADFINIDTGPLQFSVPKKNGGIIHSAILTEAGETHTLIAAPVGGITDRGPWISVAGETHFAGLLTSNSVPAANDPIKKYESYIANDWGEDFNQYGLWDLSVTIEEQGDLHAVIRISGTHLDDNGIAYSSFITRVHAYRGQSQLKIDHTLVFTGTGNDQISDYGFRLPYAGTSTLIEGIAASTGEVTHLEYATYNTPGAANVAGQANGYITRQNSKTNISVVLKDMAENFPKGLVATTKGIDIQLYPSSAPALNLARYSSSIDSDNGETSSITKNRSSQGLSKTDTFVIDFGMGNLNQIFTENLARQVNAGPLLALADGDWYSAAKVMGVGDFSFNTDKEISERHFRIDRKLKVIEDFMRFNQRKQFNWYGMLNYGDIRGYFKGGCAPGHSADCTWSEQGRYGWSGNSGEPSNQLWLQFLRNPSRDLFTDASALAKHSQDLQMIHYGDATKHSDESMAGGRNREFAVGSMHRHGVDAWSGYGQQPEYSHVAGIETYYYLTGDGRAKETLFEAAAFMTRYSIGTPSHTALVNGIDVLTRAAAVFYDQPAAFNRFNDRLEILVQDTFANDGVDNELGDSSLGESFGYFVRGAAGLMYHHELTGDSRSAKLILDAADIISQGGDKWGVGNDGESGSVWYYLNNLTYAHSIADEYGRNKAPYYSLVNNVLGHNDHSSAQSGSDAISLASFAAMPTDWKNWRWDWDEGELDPAAPALLHITRQMTYRNNFMQDYHSYRAFVHLATAAALIAPE